MHELDMRNNSRDRNDVDRTVSECLVGNAYVSAHRVTRHRQFEIAHWMDVPAAQVFSDGIVTPRKLPREFCSDHSRRREHSEAGMRKRNEVKARTRSSPFTNLRK